MKLVLWLGQILVLVWSGWVAAQPQISPQPYFQPEVDVPDLPPLPAATDNMITPQGGVTADTPLVLGEADLLANLPLTEQLINRTIVGRQWDLLASLLTVYPQISGHDPILLDYAQGALARQQGRHKRAIAAYRRILAAQPELSYVRLDLAIMLYEDKQYAAAQDQLQRFKVEAVSTRAVAVADAYLRRIRQQTGWQSKVGASYVRNDNVNQASAVRELARGGRKNDDSLPKSGQGVRYQAELARDWALGGNHYVHIGAGIDGTHYWNQPDYREQTWRITGGYKNQQLGQWFSVLPFVEQNRLAGKAYSRHGGVNVAYGRWFGSQWQGVGHYQFTRKRYTNVGNRRFEGNSQGLSLTVAYLPSASVLLYGGVDGVRDDLRDKAESSLRHGVRLGVSHEWAGGLSTRIDGRYSLRRFAAKPDAGIVYWSGYDFRRRDHEYQASLGIWHRAVHWRGITPKLNLRYLKIDSNMPAFYRRQNWQGFVSLEKTF